MKHSQKAASPAAEISELHLPDSPVETLLEGNIVQPLLTKNLNIQLTLKRWDQLARLTHQAGTDLRSEIEFIVMNTPMVQLALDQIEQGRLKRQMRELQKQMAA